MAVRSNSTLSPCDVRPHQAEVRGAASDVADEYQFAVVHLIGECVAVIRHPRVKGGQRLFQQRQVLQSGLARRFHRQLAGFLVERSRNRQNDFLVLEAPSADRFHHQPPSHGSRHCADARGNGQRLRRETPSDPAARLRAAECQRCDRWRSGTATTSPKILVVPEPAPPARGP